MFLLLKPSDQQFHAPASFRLHADPIDDVVIDIDPVESLFDVIELQIKRSGVCHEHTVVQIWQIDHDDFTTAKIGHENHGFT